MLDSEYRLHSFVDDVRVEIDPPTELVRSKTYDVKNMQAIKHDAR